MEEVKNLVAEGVDGNAFTTGRNQIGISKYVTCLPGGNMTNESAELALREAVKKGEIQTVKNLLEQGVKPVHDDHYPLTLVMLAVLNKDAEMVRLLLQYDAPIHAMDQNGKTALSMAVEQQQVAIVKMLLEKGATFNWRKNAPLLEACAAGAIEIVNLLIQHKADINVRDEEGNTPLLIAVRKKNLTLVQTLLASVTKKDVENQTIEPAFSLAVCGADEQLVQLFLERPSLLSQQIVGDFLSDEKKIAAPVMRLLLEHLLRYYAGQHLCLYRVLNAASQYGFLDIVNQVADQNILNVSDEYEKALEIASEGGQLAIVERLLALGVLTDSKDSFVITSPLIVACANGHVAVAKALLEHDAKIEFFNMMGETALLAAVKNKHIEIVKLLLSHGANINVFTQGENRFWKGFRPRSVEEVETMSEIISLERDRARTPLMIAAENGDLEMVRLLLQHKADYRLATSKGKTAFVLAVQAGHADVAELFLSECAANPNVTVELNALYIGVDREQPLLWDVLLRRDIQTLSVLIKYHVDVNQPSKDGKKPLLYAVEINLTEMAKLLLEGGASTDIYDQNGNPLLSIAQRNNNLEMVKMLSGRRTSWWQAAEEQNIEKIQSLLAQGQNINQQDELGRNILLYTLRLPDNHPDNLNVAFVKWLLTQDIDINQCDNEGKNALMYLSALHIEIDLNNLSSFRFHGEYSALLYQKVEQLLTLLLQKGNCAINHQDTYGNTALLYACESSGFSIIELLLAHGADPNIKNKKLITAFMWCAARESVEKANLLLKYHADVFAKDAEGKNALFYTTSREMIQFLAAHQVDCNTVDNNGDTRLISFCREDILEIDAMHALLDVGADADIQDGKGKTALMILALRNPEDIFFDSDIEDLDISFDEILEEPEEHGIMVRLTCETDLHIYDDKELNALEYACIAHNFTLVQLFVAAGASPASALDLVRQLIVRDRGHYDDYELMNEIFAFLNEPSH